LISLIDQFVSILWILIELFSLPAEVKYGVLTESLNGETKRILVLIAEPRLNGKTSN